MCDNEPKDGSENTQQRNAEQKKNPSITNTSPESLIAIKDSE
jgi:hypothetical protein